MPGNPEIYLDYNAGAPLRSEVIEALLRFFPEAQNLGNPSSPHSSGRRSRKLLAQARRQIGQSLGLDEKLESQDDRILLTRSGTEANQLAIRSVLMPRLKLGKKTRWILSRGEHASVLNEAVAFERLGGFLDWLPLTKDGSPDLSALSDLYFAGETALLSLIWVNNETGVLTDIAQAQKWAEKNQVPLHIDGVQAWGRIQINLDSLGADYVSFSGHKIGAMGGSGVLWVNPRARIPESPSGTVNLMSAFALGVAAQSLTLEQSHGLQDSRDRLWSQIEAQVPETKLNGRLGNRVSNTLNLNFKGVEQEGLVAALDLQGILVSAGSACTSGSPEPSTVLRAMGLSRAQSLSAIRISLGRELSDPEIERILSAIKSSVAKLKGRGPSDQKSIL